MIAPRLQDAGIEQIDATLELDFKKKEKIRLYRHEGHLGVGVSSAYSIVCPLERQSYYKKNEGEKIEARREETASQGTEAHKLIELQSQGQEVVPKEELGEWFQTWNKTQQEFNITSEYSEVRVFSHQFSYGGTIDRIGMFHGQRCVIDFKTGRYSHLDLHKTEAYRQAYIEMTGDKDVGCVVLYLPRPDLAKKGFKPKHYTIQNHIPCFSAFLSGYYLFRMMYYSQLHKLGMEKEDIFRNPLFDLYEREKVQNLTAMAQNFG